MPAELSPVRVEDNLILSGEAAPYAIVLIGIRTKEGKKIQSLDAELGVDGRAFRIRLRWASCV